MKPDDALDAPDPEEPVNVEFLFAYSPIEIEFCEVTTSDLPNT